MVRPGAVALIAALALGALAPVARGDGDPGSDVLVYQDLFVPSDTGVSVHQQVQLGDLLRSADRSGFPVRVAIIARSDDLGAVTELWRKPAAYARFLGIELSLAYKQRLLVVMPDGFGFSWPGHSTGAAYRLLAKLPLGAGGSGLAQATAAAVRRLAVAAGVKIAQPADASPSAAESASGGSAASRSPPRTRPRSAASAGGGALPLLSVAAVLAAGTFIAWLLMGGRLQAEPGGAVARVRGLRAVLVPRRRWGAPGFALLLGLGLRLAGGFSRWGPRARRRARRLRATRTSIRARACPGRRPISPSPTNSASRCRCTSSAARW